MRCFIFKNRSQDASLLGSKSEKDSASTLGLCGMCAQLLSSASCFCLLCHPVGYRYHISCACVCFPKWLGADERSLLSDFPLYTRPRHAWRPVGGTCNPIPHLVLRNLSNGRMHTAECLDPPRTRKVTNITMLYSPSIKCITPPPQSFLNSRG